MKHRISLALFLAIAFLLISGQVLAQATEEYTGELEDDKDKDLYTIELNEGDGVIITAIAANGSDIDTVLTLENSDEDEVAENDDYEFPDSTDSQIAYVAEEDDTYTVIVSSYGESSGEYELTIEYVDAEEVEELEEEEEPEINTTPERDPDFEDEGELDDEEEVEYPFDLEAGQGVIAALYGTDEELDAMLSVLDPNGNEIVSNDDRGDYTTLDSQVAFTASEAGEYTVVVTNYPGAPGAYRLEVYFANEEEVAYAEQALRVVLTGPVETHETTNFVVHYTLEGDDATELDFVEAVGEAAEEVLKIQVEQLGWALPPSDGVQGGDGRYDIYIENIPDAYGYASSSSAEGDNPNTEVEETSARPAYLILDNDYSEYPNPISSMRTTVAHEFHHVVQFGYDDADIQWYYESTASWMETVTFPDEEEATIYVESVFMYPEICFGGQGDADPSGQGVYGTWLFLEFMQTNLDEDAPILLWENIAQSDELEPLEATLAEFDTTLPEFVALYHINNLVRDYQFVEGFENQVVWLEEIIDDEGQWTVTGEGIQEMGANYFEFSPNEGVYTISFSEGGDTLDIYAVGINGDEGDVFYLEDEGTIDTDGYDNVYLIVYNYDYDSSLDDCDYSEYELDVEESNDNPLDPFMTVNAENFEELENP